MFLSVGTIITHDSFISYGGILAAVIGGIALVLSAKVTQSVRPTMESLVYIRESIESTNEIAKAANNLAIEQDKKLEKIHYALWNSGKTGLVNKVDDILTSQAAIQSDIAVLKAVELAIRISKT
jgi:hypothetical protein